MAGADPSAEPSDLTRAGLHEVVPPTPQDAVERREADEGEAWGFLPVHERERFLSWNDRDFPIRYRAWIDAYYRRLNRSRR